MGCLFSCFEKIEEEPMKKNFSDILYYSDNSDEYYETIFLRNNYD